MFFDWLLELWSGHPQGFSLYPHVLCNLATSFVDKHHLQASVSLKAAAPYNNWTFRKEIQQYKFLTKSIFQIFRVQVFLLLVPAFPSCHTLPHSTSDKIFTRLLKTLPKAQRTRGLSSSFQNKFLKSYLQKQEQFHIRLAPCCTIFHYLSLSCTIGRQTQ